MASLPPFEKNLSSIFKSSSPKSIIDNNNNEVISTEIKLPVIDLSLLMSDEKIKREKCAKQIAKAAKEWGFFQIVNHGVPKEAFEMMFFEVKKLFEIPFSEKENFPNLSKNTYRWGNPNATSLAQYSLSEAFHITLAEISKLPNERYNLRPTLEMYAKEMAGVAQMICEVLEKDLNMKSKQYFENVHELKNSFVRVNKYPPRISGSEMFGLIPHTDSSFITILFQDQIGGLQLKKDGKWIGVKPCHDSLIVNIGDLFQAVSNGVYESVKHRVIAPVEVERLSIAFFVCPYQHTLIESFQDPKKYKRFTFKEYKDQNQRDIQETGDKIGLSNFLI